MIPRLFIAKNLYNNVKAFLDGVKHSVTDGMDDNEKCAYDLGVENTLSSLSAHIMDDYPVVCLEVENDEEMTVNEVFERFKAEIDGSAFEDDYE